MKTIGKTFLLLAFGLCAYAQQWEVGGIGGVGFLDTVHVNTATAGSGNAGFSTGAVAGAFIGSYLNAHWSGEIRYEFFDSSLKLSGDGSSATFSGVAHAVHYDLIYHFNRKHSPVQFFVALGGGMKIFDGTGAPNAYQPLQQFGYFTQTHQIEPMLSAGGGISYKLGDHLYFRTEIRDFVSPFPKNVIAPAVAQPSGQQASFGKVLQNLVPMVGIEYLF
ncbi:MAG: outer membrane beta-barrel protein [Bryobacteraceae bacterium]|jgi:hypothetical protein